MNALRVAERAGVANGRDHAANVPPILAAVDSSAAGRAAIGEAVRLGGELEAPIVFVYVRRGPASFFGTPIYQRRLSKEMARARRVLDRALAVAASADGSRRGRDPRGLTEAADPGVRL